jgi:hypothetical protein
LSVSHRKLELASEAAIGDATSTSIASTSAASTAVSRSWRQGAHAGGRDPHGRSVVPEGRLPALFLRTLHYDPLWLRRPLHVYFFSPTVGFTGIASGFMNLDKTL